MPTAQATSTGITLKGSVAIVTEFFEYSINNILYQREIYPPEMFKKKNAYGLVQFVTTDEELQGYLTNVMDQMQTWLETGSVHKLVLVIMTKPTKENDHKSETLERWVFDLVPSEDAETGTGKSDKDIKAEIAAIQRQITSTVTFLPLSDDQRVFDLLVYTDTNTETPVAWEVSDPRHVTNADHVQLRSFDTTKHKVETFVSYKVDDD